MKMFVQNFRAVYQCEHYRTFILLVVLENYVWRLFHVLYFCFYKILFHSSLEIYIGIS